MWSNGSAIQLEKLTKTYPGGRGVRSLDLTVAQGTVFGFVGPNGAGKSTTIRTLMGLLRPTSGSARIFGTDVTRWPAAVDLRARVGYAPSEPRLSDKGTVQQILEFSAGFFEVDTRIRRQELSELLDLDLSRRAHDLSLGNKKKVQIVAALQHRPELLILDEPTNGLDPVIQRRLFQLLIAEKSQGTTIFYSSHVLSEIERVCDSVAILREGALVENAKVAELRARRIKRVRLRFEDPDSAARARALGVDGVRDIELRGPELGFNYQGAMTSLLAALAQDAPIDLSIEDPGLEEIVLSHYAPADEKVSHA